MARPQDGGAVGGTAALGGGLLIQGANVTLNDVWVNANSARGGHGGAWAARRRQRPRRARRRGRKRQGRRYRAGRWEAHADRFRTLNENAAHGGSGGSGGGGGPGNSSAGQTGSGGSAGAAGKAGINGENGGNGGPGGNGTKGGKGRKATKFSHEVRSRAVRELLEAPAAAAGSSSRAVPS